ncbi:MAG TPA: heme exporter protein CcmD [Burkholderiales bacterium]|nr:heme exporter protein CcmD [Burkholderiales bacterium]
MSEFLAMGGYASYVWGAYGVTAAALAIEILLLLRRKRETKT